MSDILKIDNIRLSAVSKTKEEAIKEAGTILIQQGYVQEDYIEKMFGRENIVSTYMGNLLAIPHGTDDSKETVTNSGLVILLFDKPIDWDGNNVRVVIGIAGKNDEHIEILSKIAITCSELENVKHLLQLDDREAVLRFFSEVNTIE